MMQWTKTNRYAQVASSAKEGRRGEQDFDDFGNMTALAARLSSPVILTTIWQFETRDEAQCMSAWPVRDLQQVTSQVASKCLQVDRKPFL